jgi:hypothetical protein
MAYPPPPYADAVCGTYVCGEAICGAWWAYPPSDDLGLGGNPPTVEIIQGDIVPSAGLALGAITPALVIADLVIVSPPSAGLRLGGTVPVVGQSSIVSPPPAGLALGGEPPESVGSEWLTDLDCIEMTPALDTEYDLVLVGAGESDLDLEEGECL